MKKCVMLTSVALVLVATLMSCEESSDSLSTEDRAMRDGRREVQDVRPPPGPPEAAMIEDSSSSSDSDSDDSGGD